MKRPPIIIINPDEMRSDAMGHMGNPQALTPVLDDFAASQAVSFRSAYCQNPVCVPSRCSFLTGLYPHTRGHRTMSYLLREGETSLFKELKDAGYYVWMNARNDLVAGQIDGLAASHADEIYYGETRQKIDPAMIGRMFSSQKKEDPFPYSHFSGLSRFPMDSDLQDTKAAIERILHPVDERPLCLFLGWVNPHPPYQVEEPYYSAIKRDGSWKRIPYTKTRNKSRMIQRLREENGMDTYSPQQWEELRAVYLAQCYKVDTMFGMIIDALKEAGIYDDSAIFFLSDHGDFAGDYDMTEKAQNTFEDCLTKVPLLIKPPKGEAVDPGIADGLTELVDFYATALDYAGVTPSQDHFGRSLRPLITDRRVKNRDFVTCEGGRMSYETQADEYHAGSEGGGAYAARQKIQTEADAHEKGTMIFDGRYKYVHRLSGNCELYDLQNDPEECANIYDDVKDSPIITDLRLKLLDHYQATSDVVPYDYDSRFTAERVFTSAQAFCPEGKEEELLAFIRSAHPSITQAIAYAMRIKRE